MSEQFKLKNGNNVLVRRLKASDYDAAQDFLSVFSTQSIFTNQYPCQPKKDKASSEKKYEDPNNCYLGAFYGDNIIALSSIHINRPEHPWVGRNAEFGISILEDYQGQGLGKYLMSLMEQWAREKGMHRINGEVRHRNTKAIALYLNCGFEIEGISREIAFINNEWHHQYHIGKILN